MTISKAAEGTMEHSTKRSTSTPKLVLEPVRQSSRIESRPLAAGRYLIGSASDCDIAISVAGVAPQHCLMIVGANKTVVKAISPLTWINDGPLTEAVLKHGERLILGPVELRTRLPEVSEWVGLNDDQGERTESPAPLPPPVSAQFEPPKIDELLDQARQHLQSAIDGPEAEVDSWSEDLPLAEAVNIHAASAAGNSQAVENAAEPSRLNSPAAIYEQRTLELDERARALDYLATELSTREEQLITREREVMGRESRLQSVVNEVDQREEALIAEERALLARQRETEESKQQVARTVSHQLEERTRVLEEEQARVQQLFALIEQQLPEIQRQSSELAAQKQALDAREAELIALEASLQQQSQEVRALAEIPVAPVDTSAIELRETALVRREAVLTTSMAALQASREQIAEESTQLELRFAELVEREQVWQQRSSELSELAQRTESEVQGITDRLAGLEQRERIVATTSSGLEQREAALQQTKADVEAREQVLISLRAELDNREESLNQQFVQLQKDRSGVRTSQLKQQISEQSGKKRLDEIERRLQLRASELDAEASRLNQLQLSLDQQQEQRQSDDSQQQLEATQQELQSLQQRFAEQELNFQAARDKLVQAEWELAEQRALLVDEQNRLEELKSTQTLVASPVQTSSTVTSSPPAEIEQQWAELAQAQAELAQDQQELALLRAELETQQAQFVLDQKSLEAARAELSQQAVTTGGNNQDGSEDTQLGAHLQALLDERRTLTELRAEVEQEHQALRAEREEAQRTRARFEQERVQLDVIKSEASSERDVFLLERQSVIAIRQTLEERERQVRQSEATAEQRKAEAEKTREELELQQKRLNEQRGHLEEEWESLREEREAQRQAEAELDAQRQELTHFAQQLEQLNSTGEPIPLAPQVVDTEDQFEEDDAVANDETVYDVVESDAETESVAQSVEAEVAEEEELEEEVVDPLAGFASFSSIGGTSSDEMLPPEIAEIIRRMGGHSTASVAPQPPPVPPPLAQVVSAQTVDIQPEPPLAPAFSHAQEMPSDDVEAQRLQDLLGGTSESYVEAASVHTDEVSDEYDVVSDDEEAYAQSHWPSSSDDQDEQADSDVSAESGDPHSVGADVTKSIELRSRLSEMFGIDLSPLSSASANSNDGEQGADLEEESNWDDTSETAVEDYAGEDEYQESLDAVAGAPVESEMDDSSGEQSASTEEEVPVDESLDPVAAYMEQLLARTRKSAARPAPPPPKPAPPPIAPIAPHASEDSDEEMKPSLPDPVVTVAAKAAKPPRKHDQVDKDALRANLDSFRSIANTQARSDVARSESKRLVITSQAKQIFLVCSSIITVILISTEFWTQRKYRLEILAGVIATTFLGLDYYRAQRRLRQLGLLSTSESEAASDNEEKEAE